jgi:hypothetical protein
MINLNVEPYYDDFDETKHFQKILFKPGYAVQARELTQMQSIIQAQIDRFGSHIFTDGSVVHDGKHAPLKANAIAIASFTGTTDFTFFKDKIIYVGSVKKRVVHTAINNDNYYLFTTDVTDGNIEENATILVQDYANYSLTSESSANTIVYGDAMLHEIKSGIYFVNGAFVRVEDQIIVGSYSSNKASFDVYLVAYEYIISYNEDESLLDNAYGSPNYAAPGADRHSIELVLETTMAGTGISTNSKHFLIASYRDGVMIGNVNAPEYSDLEKHLADRTYQESGDYTVKPFIGQVIDHPSDESKFVFKLDTGSAFVQGYQVATEGPTSLIIDKARTTAFLNNSQIQIDKGPYILVENLTGLISPYSMVTIDIHNVITPSNSATNYVKTKIGTATAFGTVYDSTNTGTTNTYKLFLTDIALDATASISNARSFVVTTGSSTYSWTFYAQYSTESYDKTTILGATTTDVTIQNSQNYTQLFKLGNTPVKTHVNSGTNLTDITYQYYKSFTSTSFARSAGSSSATLTLSGTQFFIGSGILSSSTVSSQWYATVRSVGSGSGTPPAVGQVFKLENGTVNVSSDTSAVVTVPVDYNMVLDVYVVIGESTSTFRNKVLHTGSTLTVTGSNMSSSTISLLKADGISLTSVIDNNGTDHIDKYSFNTGQKDYYYDHAYIKLINPNKSPLTTDPDITSLVITFDYYSHTGTGPLTVDSYNGLVDYSDIQSYRTKAGEILRLTDVMDFRPRRTDGSTSLIFDSYKKPHFGSTLTTDYEYYLPRIDKAIISTASKKLEITKGIPAKYPLVPDSGDSMTLYVLTIPAYTFSISDIIVEYVDNKRYTMKDIAAIDTRVSRLEYYTTLSLLEKQATDESIPSDVPGIDKFKNGILVDSFAGHSVGDVFNPYYTCAIDYQSRYLRPGFNSNSFAYQFDSNASTSVVNSNDLVMLDYTEVSAISQTAASETESVQPFAVFNWNGIMAMDPPTDIWTDTSVLPMATVNLNGEFDHLVQAASGNAQIWSDWQTTGVGITNLALKNNVSVKSQVTVN